MDNDSGWKEWEWMGYYRVWETNRRVFANPGIYCEPYAAALKRGRIQGMNPAAQKLIESVQVFNTADKTLWHLSEHDNIDKHRLVVTVANAFDAWGASGLWFPERKIPLVADYEIYAHVIGDQQRSAVENRAARIEQYVVN